MNEALEELSTFSLSDAPLGDTLQWVGHLALAALDPVDVVGITMLDSRGRPTTAMYSDERAPSIDEAQYRAGAGPCLDAWRLGHRVRLDDMTEARDRYPAFSEAALAHSVLSSLSLPLRSKASDVGALNLYATQTYAFTPDDEGEAETFATAAAVVVANAAAYLAATDMTVHLQEALKSRAVIEQAKGMLMANAPDLTPDAAFAILRRASQRENVKLREIALRIVERRPIAEAPDT